MNALVQQILTLAAVLFGASTSFAATSLTERSRWKRSQSARWDDRRLVAYSEYANAVKVLVRVCYRIAIAKGFITPGQPIEIESGLNALTDAENERAVKWETVLLLGEPGTISAARTWHESVWKLELIIGEEGADGAKFIETYKETVHLRNLFYASARSDLGVRSGDLPQPTFGSLRLRE
jgi:hypothetical protein